MIGMLRDAWRRWTTDEHLDLLVDLKRELEESVARRALSGRKWDRRFLALAAFVSTWSKDPSTRCGAVLARGKEVVSLGFNGFPSRLEDDPALYADRDAKLARTVHAEINAVLYARRDLEGCTLYTWPFGPCSRCASQLVQAGVARCVFPPTPPELEARWGADRALADSMLADAGVEVQVLEGVSLAVERRPAAAGD